MQFEMRIGLSYTYVYINIPMFPLNYIIRIFFQTILDGIRFCESLN
jgi:hypothetical protein